MRARATLHEEEMVPEIKSHKRKIVAKKPTRSKASFITSGMVRGDGMVFVGKEYAGRSIEISKPQRNVITLKTGKVVPDNEKWLYEGDNLQRLQAAIEWAENTPRKDNFEELFSAFKKWSDEND